MDRREQDAEQGCLFLSTVSRGALTGGTPSALTSLQIRKSLYGFNTTRICRQSEQSNGQTVNQTDVQFKQCFLFYFSKHRKNI